MKLYRKDSEVFFVRSDGSGAWELFDGLAPMLFTPSMMQLPLVKYLLDSARPCEWEDLPDWAKEQIEELIEGDYLKGERE